MSLNSKFFFFEGVPYLIYIFIVICIISISLQTQLFETGKFSDFTIQCEGMDFKVHRVVLGPKSPVFMAAMDKEGPMLIRDVDSGTMQVCLIV